MYKVNYNSKANNDLMTIAYYIAEESNSLEVALAIVRRMKKRIDNRLELFPLSGTVEAVVDGIEYRKAIVEKYH